MPENILKKYVHGTFFIPNGKIPKLKYFLWILSETKKQVHAFEKSVTFFSMRKLTHYRILIEKMIFIKLICSTKASSMGLMYNYLSSRIIAPLTIVHVITPPHLFPIHTNTFPLTLGKIKKKNTRSSYLVLPLSIK